MKKYGLLGRNISYSFSQKHFEGKFSEQGIIDSTYDLFDIPSIDQLPEILLDRQIVGLNITIPYKVEVIRYLDSIDPAAQAIGAVNTIKVLPDGKLHGANTDIYGFAKSIAPFIESRHDKALILGSGGASKAVAYVLSGLGIDYWYVLRKHDQNISPERQFTYSQLSATHVKTCTLIVNCTPVGTHPNVDECPDIPYDALDHNNLLYDLVYNPLETKFMRNGREKGAVAVGGLTMLKLQAEKSWEIWQKD